MLVRTDLSRLTNNCKIGNLIGSLRSHRTHALFSHHACCDSIFVMLSLPAFLNHISHPLTGIYQESSLPLMNFHDRCHNSVLFITSVSRLLFLLPLLHVSLNEPLGTCSHASPIAYGRPSSYDTFDQRHNIFPIIIALQTISPSFGISTTDFQALHIAFTSTYSNTGIQPSYNNNFHYCLRLSYL